MPNLNYVSLDCSLSMTLDTGEAVFASSRSEGMTEVIEGNDSLPNLWRMLPEAGGRCLPIRGYFGG